MLTRFHKLLIALLAVQIALAVVTLTRDDDAAPPQARPLLAGFDAAAVTRVQVFADSAEPPIDLVKQQGSWVVASSFAHPADAAKLDALLAPLAKLAVAAPIATQPARHKQLRVADGDFERKLVITGANGQQTTLYVGSAAGARRNAVRRGDDARVFAVAGVAPWSIGATAGAWVDTRYVSIPRDDVAKLTIARAGTTIELTRVPAASAPAAGSGSAPAAAASPAWTATIDGAPLALAAGETLDTDAVDRLVGQATGVTLASPGDPKRDASRPAATITIAKHDASAAPVVIDIVADGTSYWVRERGRAHAALVDKATLDDLVTAGRDQLVNKPAPGATSRTPPPASGATSARSG